MLRIVVEKSGQVLQDGIFAKDFVSVGRGGQNDVILEHPYVSSQHLVVRKDEEAGAFRLFDQSQNGTVWQGRRVSTLRFDQPTLVKIGEFDVTLIPIRGGDTEEVPADLFAPTVLEMPPEQAPASTAPYKKVNREEIGAREAELRSITSQGELKTVIFNGDVTIGRSPECELQLASRDISRRHALIYVASTGYAIRRLSTKNPLMVNGRELEAGESLSLRDGDVIQVCDEEVVFLYPATQPGRTNQTVPLEASPNLDLAVTPRGCADETIAAFDVVGFLGSKTWQKFEDRMLAAIRESHRLLIDLGYLVGIDREGMQSLGRVIKEAESAGVKIQIIRVTPRIADLLSYSQLKQMLTLYISRSEDTAIKRLHA